MFLTFNILPDITRPIYKRLFPQAMLKIIESFPSVLSLISMDIRTCPIGLVVIPITFVYIWIRMNKFAFSIEHIFGPVSFIDGIIWEFLLSVACFLSV